MKKLALIDWDGSLREGFTIQDWTKFLEELGLVRRETLRNLSNLFEQYAARLITHDQLAQLSAEVIGLGLSGGRAEAITAATIEFVAADSKNIFGFVGEALNAFATAGYEINIVSGAPGCVVREYKAALKVEATLHCLEFAVDNGLLTGRVTTNPGTSQVKKLVASEILAMHKVRPFVIALGNSASDVPLFENADVGLVVDNTALVTVCPSIRVDKTYAWGDIALALGKLGVPL